MYLVLFEVVFVYISVHHHFLQHIVHRGAILLDFTEVTTRFNLVMNIQYLSVQLKEKEAGKHYLRSASTSILLIPQEVRYFPESRIAMLSHNC